LKETRNSINSVTRETPENAITRSKIKIIRFFPINK